MSDSSSYIGLDSSEFFRLDGGDNHHFQTQTDQDQQIREFTSPLLLKDPLSSNLAKPSPAIKLAIPDSSYAKIPLSSGVFQKTLHGEKTPYLEAMMSASPITDTLVSRIGKQVSKIDMGSATQTLERFKGKVFLIAGKATDMFVAHQDRVAGVHATKTAKAAALLLTVCKVAITVAPLLAACPPMGFVILGGMLIAPLICIGIKSAVEKYAAKKFPIPLEGTKEEIRQCLDLRNHFVMKQMNRLSTAGQITGWVMNPLGNLAGAIFLKLGDSAQKQIIKKWGQDDLGAKAALCFFEGFKFLGFHAGRLLVPTLLDTPVQLLAKHIKSHSHGTAVLSQQASFVREKGVINGQNIGDRHYEELLWKSYHNLQASSSTQTHSLGQFASQWIANQKISPMQAAQDPHVTAFEVDLTTNGSGDIVLTHGGLPLGTAAETREFFTALANNLNQDNGRMVSFHIDNFGRIPLSKLDSYFRSIHASNTHGGQEGGPSLVDLMAKPNEEGRYKLTLEEYYSKGQKAFVDVSHRAGQQVEWGSNNYHTVSGYHLNWRPQEVFDRASDIADGSSDYYDQVHIPFQSNIGNFTATGAADELINMRLGAFMKQLLSQHRTIKGGVLDLDYANSHTEDLDALIKIWNETPPAHRVDLLDLWDKQGHVDIQASLTHDALNLVARRMFLSTFLRNQDPSYNLREDAVNPIGDIGDMTHLLKPKKKSKQELYHGDLYRGWNNRFKKDLKNWNLKKEEIPQDCVEIFALLIRAGKKAQNEQHFHVARSLLKSHFKRPDRKKQFLELLLAKYPKELKTYVQFLNTIEIGTNVPARTKKEKAAKEESAKDLQQAMEVLNITE